MPDPFLLPVVDEDPDEWGPDHDQLVGEILDEATIAELVALGNRQGRFIQVDDDTDNGLDL